MAQGEGSDGGGSGSGGSGSDGENFHDTLFQVPKSASCYTFLNNCHPLCTVNLTAYVTRREYENGTTDFHVNSVRAIFSIENNFAHIPAGLDEQGNIINITYFVTGDTTSFLMNGNMGRNTPPGTTLFCETFNSTNINDKTSVPVVLTVSYTISVQDGSPIISSISLDS